MAIVAEELHRCPTLNTLDLCNNVRGPGETAGAGKADYRGKGAGKGAVEIALTPVQTRQLVELTISLAKLSSLEKLHLDSNQLSELTTVGNLTGLKLLSLQNNRLSALPEDIGLLRGLKRLSLRGNKLKEVHAAIGFLSSLEALDLRGNKLTYLPNSIGQLRTLKSLDIADNALMRLELAVCDLVALEKLEVSGNPLQRPPLALAKQGIPNIRRYFQELAKSGETTSNAGRLVLLGHGESGKTSLQRGLRHGGPRPADKDERTIQLDIYSLLLGEGADQVLICMYVHAHASARCSCLCGTWRGLICIYAHAHASARCSCLCGTWRGSLSTCTYTCDIYSMAGAHVYVGPGGAASVRGRPTALHRLRLTLPAPGPRALRERARRRLPRLPRPLARLLAGRRARGGRAAGGHPLRPAAASTAGWTGRPHALVPRL